MGQTIGEKIASLRKERHITQTELAEYLVLVPQTISKWEVGNGTPDVALLPRIADFFGVSVDELFGRTSLEHAKDLVLKYSILRDDHSFHEALGCLHSQLQTIDAALESGIENRESLERDKVELQGYEMHLFLQQSRESALKALKLAEDLAGRTGDIRFRLQRLQLHMELGDIRWMLQECEDILLGWGLPQEKYTALWILANLYKKKGMKEKCDALKPQLLKLMPRENENPYVVAKNRQRIEQL